MVKNPSKLPKIKKLKYYKDRAWKQFSEFIRRRDSNNGYAKCCTCELIDEWRHLQAGHYVAGRNNSILFREDNCHAQCLGCNFFGSSDAHNRYYLFMKARYGIEIIDKLNVLSNRELILEREDYIKIEETYKQKIKDLIQ